MRTNIDIDDALMIEAMKATGASTKKAAVETALLELVREYHARKALDDMKGLGWDGDLDAMREDITDIAEL